MLKRNTLLLTEYEPTDAFTWIIERAFRGSPVLGSPGAVLLQQLHGVSMCLKPQFPEYIIPQTFKFNPQLSSYLNVMNGGTWADMELGKYNKAEQSLVKLTKA